MSLHELMSKAEDVAPTVRSATNKISPLFALRVPVQVQDSVFCPLLLTLPTQKSSNIKISNKSCDLHRPGT